MAKKKKFGASLKQQVNLLPVVKEKAPRTISTNVSTGGMRSAVSSTTQSVAKSARQKAEEDRSARMRQGLSSIARSSFNRQFSKPTYVNRSRLLNLNKNPLAPVKSMRVTGGHGMGEQRQKNLFTNEKSLLKNTQFVTGGNGVGESRSALGAKKTDVLQPVKKDIRENYYDAVRTVGMKGSRNERKVYRPMWQRDEEGQVSSNQRRLENAARGGNRKAQVEAEMGRTKARTVGGRTYDQFINAELNKKGLLGQDYILRGKDPSQEALDYRQRYGFDEEALNQIKAIADNAPENGGNGRSVLDRLKFGFDESWRARNIEDTYERQYGKPIDEDTQAQLDAVRDSGGYMVGNMLGQASQFAMTAPYSGVLEGSLMARMGLKGGRAAINTTMDAVKYAGARISADQILSAPINLLDAMKEDNVKDIVKRFGMNSGMDIIFGGLIEIPAFRKNYKFVKAIKANDAANAMEAGAEKTAAKVSAQKQLSKAIDSMDEQTKRQIVLRLNETAENARIQRAMDFKNDAELLFQDGYVASRDAVNASVEHGIAEADSYEWQVAYDAARRNGADEEDAIEFADASLEDAIANNHVRQPRETEVDRASETLANVETPSDTLARAQAQADADDVLLNARREADNNTGIIGANERPMPTQEERGTYGQDVIARDRRRLYNQEEIRYLRDRERPRNAYEEDLWNEEFERVLRENYGSRDAEDRAFAAADRAVALDRETRLRNARERIKNKENLERVRERAKAKEQAKEKTRGQEIADRLAKEKQARQSAEEVVETAEKATNTNSVDDVIETVNSTENAMPREKAKESKPKKKKTESKKRSNKTKAVIEDANTEPSNPQTVDEAAEKLVKRWSTGDLSESAYRRNIERYKKMSVEELESEKRSLRARKGNKEEASDRINLINAIISEKTNRPQSWEDLEGIRFEPEDLNAKKRTSKADNELWTEEQKQASQDSRKLTQEERKAAREHGEHEHGMPKNMGGRDTTKAADSYIHSEVDEDFKLKEMENAHTDNSTYQKYGKKFKPTLESAAERYESDPKAFVDRVDAASKRFTEGKLPKNYDHMEDYFADVKHLSKVYHEQKLAIEKNGGKFSEEWHEIVNKGADLANSASAAGSVAGSDLNFYKIFCTNDPAFKRRQIEQNFNRLQERFEKRLQKNGITLKELPDEMVEAIVKAEEPQEAAKAWADASIYIWNQIPASFKEKIDFYRINAMLLNPKTHIRNVFGNAFFMPLREVKNITGTGLEVVAQKFGWIDKSSRRKALVPLKEGVQYAGEILDKYGDILRDAPKMLENLSNGRPLDIRADMFMAGRENGNAVVNGFRKFLDGAGHFDSKWLEKEDMLFFNKAFKTQYGRTMKARGLTVDDLINNPKLRDEITEIATSEALRATYRDNSAVARAFSRWKNPRPNASALEKGAAVALDAIVPFTKTPINILRRALEYSPIGGGEGIYHLLKGFSTHDQKYIVRGLDELASAVSGTGIGLLGFMLAKNDRITANLGNDDDGAFMRDLGKQNFSIVFKKDGDGGELSYSLDWMAPGCMPLFTGVAVKEWLDEDGNLSIWEATDVLEKMLEPSIEMSVMQGIKNTMETFSKESNLKGAMSGLVSVGLDTGLSYLGQLNPTLVGQINRAFFDPTRRDTSSNASETTKRAVERWRNKQFAKIPFLSKTLPEYTNAWGEAQSSTYSKNPAGRFVESFLSPGYLKEFKPDSVEKELINIYGQNPSATGLFPEKNWKGEVPFQGKSVKLERAEIQDYNKNYGKVSKERLKQLMDSAEYKNASLSEKQKMIRDVYADANVEATKDTLLKKGYDEWEVRTDNLSDSKKDYQAAKDAGISAEQYEYYATTKDWDKSGNGSAYKSEAVMFLNSQDLTDEQRAALFPLYSTAKNPYLDGTAHTTDWEAQYEKDLAKSDKTANTKEGKILEGAGQRSGGLASKMFNTSIANKKEQVEQKAEELGSNSSSGKSKGRSGRRGGGGGSSKTKKRAKTASEKRFAALQKMQAPTTGKGIEGLNINKLTKSQKKALIKLLQKKLDV